MNNANPECNPSTWRKMFASLRYQICFVVEFRHKLQPVLKYVLGRLGSRNQSATDYFDKLPWNIWSDDLVTPDCRKHDPSIAYDLFPLFLLSHVYAARAEDRQKERRIGKLKDLFCISQSEFQEVDLDDVFEAFYSTLANIQRIERSYIPRIRKGITTTGTIYNLLSFLCPRKQAELYVSISDPEKEPSGLLNFSFGRWPGRKNAQKSLSSISSAPFGADDVLLCDWATLPVKLRATLSDKRSTAQVPFTVLKRSDVLRRKAKDDELLLPLACILSFASNRKIRQSLVRSCDIAKLRLLLTRNMEFAILPAIDKIAYAQNVRSLMESLVQKDSAYALSIENVFPIRFSPCQDALDQPAKSRVTASCILKSGHKVVVLSGQSGQGKTITLRHLAWSLCAPFHCAADLASASDKPIPVLVSAASCAKGLFYAVARELTHYGMTRVRSDLCMKLLSKGNWVLLIDGLSDVLNTQRWEEDLETVVRINDKIVIVIAVRSDYAFNTETYVPKIFMANDLCSREDVEGFLQKYGVPQNIAERCAKELHCIASLPLMFNPLLLSGVAFALRQNPDSDIPSFPGLLLRTVVTELFLVNWDNRKYRRSAWKELEFDDISGGLATLAFQMIDTDHKHAVQYDTVRKLLRDHFASTCHSDPDRAARQLRSFAVHTGIAVRTGTNSVAFRNDMVRDYFAACHIDTLFPDKLPHEIRDLVEWNKWDHVLEMACGLPNPYLASAIVLEAVQSVSMWGIKLRYCASTFPDEDRLAELCIQIHSHSCADGGPNLDSALCSLSFVKSPRIISFYELLLKKAMERYAGALDEEIRLSVISDITNIVRAIRSASGSLGYVNLLPIPPITDDDVCTLKTKLSSAPDWNSHVDSYFERVSIEIDRKQKLTYDTLGWPKHSRQESANEATSITDCVRSYICGFIDRIEAACCLSLSDGSSASRHAPARTELGLTGIRKAVALATYIDSYLLADLCDELILRLLKIDNEDIKRSLVEDYIKCCRQIGSKDSRTALFQGCVDIRTCLKRRFSGTISPLIHTGDDIPGLLGERRTDD